MNVTHNDDCSITCLYVHCYIQLGNIKANHDMSMWKPSYRWLYCTCLPCFQHRTNRDFLEHPHNHAHAHTFSLKLTNTHTQSNLSINADHCKQSHTHIDHIQIIESIRSTNCVLTQSLGAQFCGWEKILFNLFSAQMYCTH